VQQLIFEIMSTSNWW